ncbi:MAG: SOS response-associated peptidase [Chloroflexota bacterium]
MCGRFTLTADGAVIQQALSLGTPPEGLSARYNIAPSQPVAVVTNNAPDALNHFSWGLVPYWAKDPAIGNRMINARSETAHEKPSFKAAMQYRRCLIPADGWYEWKPGDKSKHKTPYFIHAPGFEVFAFAGLWERWQSPDGSEVLSCTILTTDTNDDLADLHHRMPVVLKPDEYETWLHADAMDARRALLRPHDEGVFSYYPVSTQVNKPANDAPENIVPVEEPPSASQLPLF